MVKHIVFWKFRPDCDVDQAGAEIRAALEGLRGKIPGLRHIEVRKIYKGAHDYALYTEFDTAADVEAYQTNPLHLAGKKIVHSYLESRVAADYEV